MKKQELIYNIAIVVVLLAVIVIVAIKFIIPQFYREVGIKNFNQVMLYDLDNSQLQLSRVLRDKGPSYVFLMDMRDCASCLYIWSGRFKKSPKKRSILFCYYGS